MRALRLSVAAVILLVAACGQSTDGAEPASQPGTTKSVSLTTESPSIVVPPTGVATPPTPEPGPPPGGTVLPKDQVDTGLPDTSVAVTPDGRTLTLTVMARDACSGVEATVTEETATAVKVLLTPMQAPQGGRPDQICAQVLTPRQVTVQLKEPLANRKVLITESY